ncbi:cupin domain-containing protein [Aliidiomarina sp. Khilg15.8]
MRINADFTQTASLAGSDYEWKASPQAGVERVMLDRIGEEKARATSIVRYAPESYFPRHEHPSGEEILVLSGVFSDEHGDYPAGWYLRNAPGSSHQPFSKPGADILVKLWQMPAAEGQQVRIDTQDPAAWHREEGREVCPLFVADYEQVCLQRLPPEEAVCSQDVGGAELLILSGSLLTNGQEYGQGSWLRFPAGSVPDVFCGSEGATIYLKSGHLATPVTTL